MRSTDITLLLSLFLTRHFIFSDKEVSSSSGVNTLENQKVELYMSLLVIIVRSVVLCLSLTFGALGLAARS